MGHASAVDAVRPDKEVPELFNAVQRSAAASDRCAKHMWRIALQRPEETIQALAGCVELVLTAGQKSAPVERCVRFLGALSAAAPPGEAGEAFAEALMRKLASHLGAADRGVRVRAAQALAQVLHGLPAGAAIDEALAAALADGLRLRLRDKAGGVRLAAARALARLPVPDEDGSYAEDPAARALEECLGLEKNKDVRAAIVQALPLAPDTLLLLLERLRDVAPAVRRAVVGRLCGVPPAMLSIKQRVRLLGAGLRDRDTTVKAAAEAGLARWLREECGGDPLALLELLDVGTYADEATLALKSLLAAGALDAAALAKAAAARGGGLRGAAAATAAAAAGGGAGGGAALIQPAEALMWRCVCEWIQRDAVAEGLAAAATTGASAAVRAAAASQRHEVLEAILPDSASATAALLLAHAAAGPRGRFAAAQLAHVAATCLDWADASSRRDAAEALREMMAQDPRDEEGADDDGDDGDGEGGAGASGVPLFGNGGDGRYEAAVAALAAAVHGGGPRELAAAMLGGLAALAAKAGAPLVGGSEVGGGGDGDDRGDGDGGGGRPEVCQWLQLLEYACLLLRALPARRPPPPGSAAAAAPWDVACDGSGGGATLAGVWERLVLCGLRHGSPAVRAKALEAAALQVLARPAPGGLPAAALLARRALVAREDPQVQAAAARALADLFLALGPAAVEPVLLAAGAAAGEGGGEGGREGEVATGAQGGEAGWAAPDGRGVLQLLTAAAAGALEGAERRAGGARAGGGRSSAADSGAELPHGDAALLSSAAEALAKLMLHQRLWLRAAAAGGGGGAGAPQCPSAAPAALRKALSTLLLLHFHPLTEGLPRLRQCLAVFFDVLASDQAGAAAQRAALAAAALPAARAAHTLGGGRAAAAKQPAPLLLRFALQLLLQGAPAAADGGGDGDEDDDDGGAAAAAAKRGRGGAPALGPGGGEWGAAAFAQQLLVEAEHVWRLLLARGVQPARNRPYAAALLEVAAGLPIAPGAPGLGVLLALAQRLAVACAPDAALSRGAAALLGRLAALEAGGAPAPSGGELEEVIGRLRGMCLSMEPGLQGAVGGAAGGDAAGATPARRARPATTARGAGASGVGRSKAARAAAAEAEWAEADPSGATAAARRGSAGGLEGQPSRRLPARSARVKGQSLAGVLLTSPSGSEAGTGDEIDGGIGGASSGDDVRGDDARVADARGAPAPRGAAAAKRPAAPPAAAPAPAPGPAPLNSLTPEMAPARPARRTAALPVYVPEPSLEEASDGAGGARGGAGAAEEEDEWLSPATEGGGPSPGAGRGGSPPYVSPEAPAGGRRPLGASAAANANAAAAAPGGARGWGVRGVAAPGARKGGLSLGGGARRVTVEVGSDEGGAE
ncbi:MAG: hypothetical protein J3K34DRAFT_518335 [Monoraphidium minutum]|nr:MAG: hypothetical protein J3K34DRAFT_518335 [Monoraphidium minutum]